MVCVSWSIGERLENRSGGRTVGEFACDLYVYEDGPKGIGLWFARGRIEGKVVGVEASVSGVTDRPRNFVMTYSLRAARCTVL